MVPPGSYPISIRSLQRSFVPSNERALKATAKETKKFLSGSSYAHLLKKWVNSVSVDRRDCYQAVANAILCLEVPLGESAGVLIDCHGLDTLPPLPTQFKNGISLILKGQPNVPLEAIVADLPGNVISLTFCDNAVIKAFSSEMIPAFIRTLGIENCSNFTHFVGTFAIQDLTLSEIAGQSLPLLKDNFPELRYLRLVDNAHLESIEVSKDFKLAQLHITGDHNKLTAVPTFSGLNLIVINPSGLASISDYSWFYDVNVNGANGFKCSPFLVISLAQNHHVQGKLAATLKLIEMTEYILTSKNLGQSFAKRCLDTLIGTTAASSGCVELILGKLFLEGKLIESDYPKAQKFFQLALDLEKDPAKKEVLKETIESLQLQYFQSFYQKVRALARSEKVANLPPELLQFIFSMGLAAIKEPC